MYPRFASCLSEPDIRAITAFSPDKGALLRTVLDAIRELGEQGSYVALVEYLRTGGVNCEQLVQETLEREYEEELALLELKGAVRQIRLRMLASEIEGVLSSQLATEEKRRRYGELRKQQDDLQKEMAQESLREKSF